MIKLNSISKFYKNHKGQRIVALDNLSLTVEPGEMVMLKGPSGAGKTTLLMVAGALLAPDKGSVEIFGKNPYAIQAAERDHLRAAQIGFIFQEFHLLPYLSISENIILPSLTAGSGTPDSRVKELLQQFGLLNRQHHIPTELSTGERQRVALARAFFSDPRIVLADEPTGNLDEENGRIVLTALKEFAQQGGAVILVTHESVAAQFSDRILNIADGNLIP